MTEKELKELKDYIKNEFPLAFPKYQATYSRGALNFCARDSESTEKAMEALDGLLREAVSEINGKPVYPYVMKVVENQAQVVEKNGQEVHPCPECGQPMEYREGVSKKTGKPYKCWSCVQQGCDGVEWIRDKEENISREEKTGVSAPGF